MKRIVNKENTTDTFWGGKLQYIWQEKKKQNSPISLTYKELKQMSSLQTNSGHLNQQKNQGYVFNKKNGP